MEAEKLEREEKMQFEIIKLHKTKLKLQEDLQMKAANQKLSMETSHSMKT